MLPSDKKDALDKWLEAGYKHFAEFGPENLSISKISSGIGASRSSFYHYFGDTEIFIDGLLSLHWRINDKFIETAKERCRVMIPDLYNLLGEYTTPMQFSLQLFHNRKTPAYNYLFIKTYEAVAKGFALNLFASQYNFDREDPEIYSLWLMLGEAWYSRLNPDDLSSQALQKHAEEIMESINKFVDSRLFTSIKEK